MGAHQIFLVGGKKGTIQVSQQEQKVGAHPKGTYRARELSEICEISGKMT